MSRNPGIRKDPRRGLHFTARFPLAGRGADSSSTPRKMDDISTCGLFLLHRPPGIQRKDYSASNTIDDKVEYCVVYPQGAYAGGLDDLLQYRNDRHQ
jgi:hypothetical protein